MRCDVLVKKESRKFQGSENFQRGDYSLGSKEVFCKISRNYIYKQRNSAELKKTVARSRGALWAWALASFNLLNILEGIVLYSPTFSEIVLNFILKI